MRKRQNKTRQNKLQLHWKAQKPPLNAIYAESDYTALANRRKMW